MKGSLYYFCPNLTDRSGHDFEYIKNVKKSFLIKNYRCFILQKKNSNFKSPFVNNVNILFSYNSKKMFIVNGFHFFMDAFKTSWFIYRNSINKKVSIFIDSFSYYEFLFLIFTCLVIPRKINIYLVARNENLITNNKLLNFLIIKILILKRNKFFFFSDSKKLINSYNFQPFYPITLLPIPHTKKIENNQQFKKKSTLDLIWPGLPRVNKGLEIINRVLKQKYNSNKLKYKYNLYVSSYVKKNFNSFFFIKHFDSNLSSAEYFKILNSCDVVLLPYQPSVYRYATSGIFVESIVLGKITFVMADTWMANELEKYNLHELVITFDSNFLYYIDSIISSKLLWNKINIMKSEYQKFHNPSNFNKILKKKID